MTGQAPQIAAGQNGAGIDPDATTTAGKEPSVSHRSKPPDVLCIDSQSQIDEFVDVCLREGRFAFDTEFVMEESFQPELCLIQLATAERVAIIDPYQGLDTGPIWQLVAEPEVETIVHSGLEDLAMCVYHTGKAPRNIYDAQIAAGFAGLGYPLSLQKLVQAATHVRLHKSKTLTDWRRRPLSEAQIRYGAEDVCYLPAIRKKLERRLAASGRLDWMKMECLRFEDISLYRRTENDKLARVKGSGALQGRQLAVLRDVLAWRETTAKRLNRPIRAVLKDHLLVEVAKHELISSAEVRDLRGLNLSDKHVRELCEVVRSAADSPSETWPVSQPRETETPTESVLVPLITSVLRGYCYDQNLAYGLLATKKSIQDFVRHSRGGHPTDRTAVELLQGWRGDAVRDILEGLMSGKTSVRIGSNNTGITGLPTGVILDLGGAA